MESRIWGLDLIRSISILLVVVGHSIIPVVYGNVLGGIGVEIFFVLSGFLIGQILIRDFKKELSLPSVFQFWIRRWFRTIPLYFAFIIVKFVFFDHSLGYKVIVYFLFLQNNIVGIDFFPDSWSLVIEEWFYLLIPLFLLVISYGKLNPKRMLYFLIGFILFENLFRLGWIIYTDRPFSGIIANFPFRLDSLLVGVFLAFIKLEWTSWYHKLKRFSVFALGLVLLILLLYFFGKANLAGLKHKLIWTRTIWFFAISFFIAFLFPYLESLKRPGNLVGSLIERISLYTYSIYILHHVILNSVLTSRRFSSHWYWELILAYSLIFVSAFLVYHYFEKPMMDLRDKIKIWKKN